MTTLLIEDNKLYALHNGRKLPIINPQVFVEFHNRGLGTFDPTQTYEWHGRIRVEFQLTEPKKPVGILLVQLHD